MGHPYETRCFIAHCLKLPQVAVMVQVHFHRGSETKRLLIMVLFMVLFYCKAQILLVLVSSTLFSMVADCCSGAAGNSHEVIQDGTEISTSLLLLLL